MSQKSKRDGRSPGSNKPGNKKAPFIRLQDLIPRKTVTGGSGLLFGASNNQQNQNQTGKDS
ncbi:MAG: hypothetical protein C5B50_14550 [Verrucomicrobia bacterium]|nr:MAG: hypothetical protein C5B50_14550 [Verrucomicrobiota bacterium]